MRFHSALLCAWFAVVAPLNAADAETPPGFESLFNGASLAGWHGMSELDPEKFAKLIEVDEVQAQRYLLEGIEGIRSHWKVAEGVIVNDGQGPFLTTDREFRDFELLVEYNASPGADSGIYLKSTPQVQIWQNAEGSGGLWNNSPGAPGKVPLVVADKPPGEWNSLRILQLGARTSVWLNGQLVVDHAIMENYWDRDRPLPFSGAIQLQTHGGEVRWKNLFVREIDPDEANKVLREKSDSGFTSLFNGHDLTGWAGAVDHYEVADGAIRCRAGLGGVLHTEREYSDFQVRLEFKLPPAGNNGLAIRYPGTGDTAYTGMCELQVLDTESPKYADIDPRQAHGSVYGMIPAHRGYLRPTGEWNFQEVTVQGSKIKVELNGTVIVDGDVSTVTDLMNNRPHPGQDRTRGYFGFAGHSDPVEFRAIEIRELNP